MPQTLSDKLYEQYKLRASESLRGGSKLAGRTQPAQLEPRPKVNIKDVGKYPEWYTPVVDEAPASSMLNAVGVGLWSFVDTASFGGAGALVEEERFLDFEDPLAKWTGAIGGFAGFVSGAPLKVGAKIAQKALPILGKGALKKAVSEAGVVGKLSADEVVRGMREAAKTGGLSRKATKEVTAGYRNLVRQAQVDPRMRGLKFEEATQRYLAEYAENAIGKGLMTQTEGVALQTMFNNNIFKRPIQDFIGLMGARGLAQTNPRLARVIGHTINDAIMFGAIDTIFEGVSMVEDGDYDFTAPLWGVGTGALFGQLGWLKPRGKAASFKKDFISGLKSSFARKPFEGMSREQLKSQAKFLGESLKNSTEGSHVTFSYAGMKDQSINLRSDHLWGKMKSIWGDKADDALVALLEQQKNKVGKKMMKFAITEEGGNLMQNWRRMMLGGVLFNAHTMYDTWAHEAEPDVNDVLPSFLIGAFVQRRSNPLTFDLSPKSINRVRRNMMILGADPAQLATVPTFDFRYSRFESIFNNTKYESVVELAKDLEIGGDNEIVSKDLPEGVPSARMKPNLTFDRLLPQLRPFFPNLKQIDQISAEDAKRLADAVIKIEPSYGDQKGMREQNEKDLLEVQENFERSFPELLEEINDPENILKIKMIEKTPPDGTKILSIPNSISVSEELKQKAKKGELFTIKEGKRVPLFGVDAENNPIKGDEALELLDNKADGLQTALTSADQLGLAKMDNNPRTGSITIESEALLVDVVENIRSFELDVESKFPDNSALADRFTIADSYYEYAELLQRNHALRMGKSVINAFSQQDDALTGLMERAGVMHSPELIAESFIVDSISKVNIEGSENAEQLSKDRRFLARVLALQKAASIGRNIEIWNIPENREDFLKVNVRDVQQLRKYLEGKGIKLDNISTYQQSRLIGQTVNEINKDGNLTVNQVNSLWNLTTVEGAVFGAAAEGKPSGFTVRLVDDTRVEGHHDSDMGRLAREYNEIVRKMIDDSNGLVVAEAEKLIVTDMTLMKVWHSSVAGAGIADSSQSARAMLADFMTQLGTTEKGWSAFREQIRRFHNENPDNAAVMINWLGKAGVFEPIDTARGVNWNLKKFNQEIRDRLSRHMEAYGFDAKYVERIYVASEQKGRDNLLEDSLERASEKPLDLATWHKRYRIDGKDLTKVTPEEAKLWFDVVTYYDKPNRILNANIVNKMLDRIHVDIRGDKKSWKPFTELSQGEKNWMKPSIVGDLIKLLGSQRAQVRLDVMKWNGSDVVKGSETVQYSRLNDSMNKLEIPFEIIDGRFLVDTPSADGNYIVQREVNIFHDAKALGGAEQERIRDIREKFESWIGSRKWIYPENTPDARDTTGIKGDIGLQVMEIAPGMDPIAVERQYLGNLEQPFRELINEYIDNQALDHKGRKVLRELRTKIDEEQTITPDEYDHMLTALLQKDSFTGSDADRSLIELWNGNNAQKTMSRVKLFNTKKYVRYDKDFILDVAEVHEDNPGISDPLRRIARNDGFGVAIWNDEGYATIRKELEPVLKSAGLDKDFLNNVVGNAHEKISGFDSIGFVSRDQLRFMHTMTGNDPHSFNPIKPVISSGGANSPLLLGKTLFIYSPELDGFFKGNKDADILLTKTGAKVYNPVGDQVDTSIINVGWAELNNQTNVPLRKISIESLGIMQNKNPEFFEAKLSQADANYMNNRESASMFESEFSRRLDTNLDSMSDLVRDPIALKQWVIDQLGDEGTIADAMSGESSINTLNNLVTFAMHTRDSNVMSYSDRLVKNKLYQIFIDSVINGQRSATNQYNKDDSHRYGGNAVLIPGAIFGLKPTLVDRSGKKVMIGEVMLPRYTEDLTIKELAEEKFGGFEMRFVRGAEVLTGDQVFGKDHWDVLLGKKMDSGASIGEVREALDYMIGQGEVAEGTSVGIMVRRNPRTRPNDFALMSLKGFLEEAYGNSVAVNSLDVANVMEGDYDFDKADFFFSHRKNMWDHVQRASEFFVQGQDPTEHMEDISWNLGMGAGKAKKNKHEMIASSNVFKSAIGRVQKVPRGLGYLGNIGKEGKKESDIKNFNRQRPNEKFINPKIILDGIMDRNKAEEAEFKIVLDYDNLDFFMRSALETQILIDAKGDLNPEIAQSIRSWKSEFIFPEMDNSFVPGEAKNKGIGFINDMRSDGNHQGKRVRIFRKIVKTKEGEWDETNLSELDMAIINQMLYEYGNFLGVTRDSVYENTGTQKKTEYTDAFNGADRFMNFNNNLNNDLYYKLRNRSNLKGKQWKDDPDFDSYFDIDDKSFQKGKGKYKKHIPWFVPRAKIVHRDTEKNAEGISRGTRGAPIDRIMMKFRIDDPLNASRTKVVGTAINEVVDQWYNELLGGGSTLTKGEAEGINMRFIDKADELTRGVVKGVTDYNRKAQLIQNVKKKIVLVRDSRMKYDAKKKIMDDSNSFIKKIESEIGPGFLGKKYRDSRKSKDLPKIEFVIADEKDMIDGTIYYSTMDTVRRTLPFDFKLNDKAQEALDFIKSIRKHFYGNRTRKKDFLKFGGSTLLTDGELKLLFQFPDMNTFYQIESEALAQGFKDYGPGFLYQFMQPTQNRKAVGVFNNRPVSVPYQSQETFDPSSRYRRGMRLLTGIAYGTVPTDVETMALAKKELSMIQFVESQNERFFNKRIDRKRLIGEIVGSERLDVGKLGRAAQEMIYNDMRLPNFDKDFEKLFGNFDSIKWNRDSMKISSGFNLMNDHMLDFYAGVMKLAGKEKEFESYLNTMHDINAQYMGYDFMNPREYLSIRAGMDKEVKKIARDVFVDGIFKTELNKKNRTAMDIANSPVYALMGGASYFKGVSLERAPTKDIGRHLRETKELADTMQEMKDNMSPNSHEGRKNFEQIGIDCGF